MELSKKIIIGTVGLATLSSLAVIVIPQSPSVQGGWLSTHATTLVSVVFADVFIGAAALFLTSLGVYRTALKVAFTLIALSIFFDAVGALMVMLVVAFAAWDYDGAVIALGLPFLVSGLSAYVGSLMLARLVKLRLRLMATGVAALIGLLLSVVLIFVPHPANKLTEVVFDFYIVTLFYGGILAIMASYAFVRVRSNIGPRYETALAWLSIGSVLGGIAVMLTSAYQLYSNTRSDAPSIFLSILALLSGISLLMSGYRFAKLKDF